MKSKLLLPAFVLVLAACSGNPPPPSETPLGPDEPAPSGEGPVAPASNEMVKQGRDFIQAEKFEDAKKVLSDAPAKTIPQIRAWRKRRELDNRTVPNYESDPLRANFSA
jgi:hypothetical protein